MTEKEALELLREAHREPIDEAHYAAVRARVMSHLAEQRAPRWRAWAYAFAALALLVVLIARPHRSPWAPVASRPAQAVGLTASVERPAADPWVRPTHVPGHARPPRRPIYRVVGPPAVQPPLMVKLITDDPNIVIYWISGE